MSEPFETPSKSELLNQIQAARAALEETLVQVEENQMLQPELENGWSVKDILAHIAGWEKRMVTWITQTLAGEIPQLPQNDDEVNRLNEQSYQENRGRPLSEVLAEFRQTYSQALRLVEGLDEQDLADPDRFAYRKGRPMWIMVAANTYWHYAEHRESIQRDLENRTGG